MQRRPLDIGVEMHDLHQSVDAGRCGRRRVIVMRCPAGSVAGGNGPAPLWQPCQARPLHKTPRASRTGFM